MDLKIGERTLRVHFNDWMFLQSSGVMVNRARVSKFGIAIGEVTLFFQKVARQSGISAGPFNVPTNDDVKLRVASR